MTIRTILSLIVKYRIAYLNGKLTRDQYTEMVTFIVEEFMGCSNSESDLAQDGEVRKGAVKLDTGKVHAM